MRNPSATPSAAVELTSRSASTSASSRGAPGLELLLYGLQSPINIGMILRVAETYRFRVSIYDHYRVLDSVENLETIEDFACGAVSRQGLHTLSATTVLGAALRGRRLVATSIEATGCALPDYGFRAGDVFALGNEYDGLPAAVLSRAESILHIPMPPGWMPKPKANRPIDSSRTAQVARDGRPNLNVAMTAAILCYTAYSNASARLRDPASSTHPARTDAGNSG